MRVLRSAVVGCLVFLLSAAVFSVPAAAYVVSTDPPDGAVDVPLDQPIVVVFSEPVEPSSVYWQITPAILLVPTWNVNDTVLTMYHATPFAACTEYTVAITSPPPAYEWSFTTCGFPYIVASVPANGAVDVALDSPIVVEFNQAMDTASVVVALTPPSVALTYSWNVDGTVLTLTHADPFEADAQYSVTVTGQDVYGNALIPGPVPNPWTFLTAGPPAPFGVAPTAGPVPPGNVVVRF